VTDEEMKELIVLWMRTRGGVATDEEFDSLAAVLSERCPAPDRCTLAEAKEALGLI